MINQFRGHPPKIISSFKGLWKRGDADTTPMDHFAECENLLFSDNDHFTTRPGIGISQDTEAPIANIKRIYNYNTGEANTQLILSYDNDAGEGSIYHLFDSDTLFGPILTIEGMTDFAFAPYGGRALISPFSSFAQGELTIEKGLEDEVVYIYEGDGTAARPAAGAPLSGAMTIANGAAGNTDAGIHIFGFVAETRSGYLTAPGLLQQFTTAANFSVSFGNIPTSGDPNVVARHLVATKVISSFNGNLEGYDLFFVPGGTISNNTDTFLNNISFFDQDLLEDASHLLDNYEEIPAGANLSLYNERLIVGATFDDINLALVSSRGEPEAINQISGILTVQPDGNPITNGQELRDVLYLFKRTRTIAYVDNGDEPSSWEPVIVDNALGTSVHGIATVLDSGSASVDFLIICTYQGISLFNGKYIEPELTWKVEDYWRALDRNEFGKIQIVNAPVQKWILCVLPTRKILAGFYSHGMDSKNIRWCPWSAFNGFNTVAIVNIDEIVLGADITE
jgi:hypothetical protein